ncbi:MAG: hypothetical protein J7J86_00635, partial [Bacteroidales bacterium]|nr:hypothetical protein [Bacteroidales bacterium]
EVGYDINDTLAAGLFKYFVQGNKKNYYSYFIKAGLIKITKKYNTLHLNFVLNYSPQKIGTGEYKFYNLPFDSYGKLKQNINYIGFEFAYGLSMTKNYKIKKTKKTILDNQIKFSLLPIVYKKIKFFHYGVELLKSDPGFGGEATISYSKHLKNNLCFNIGLGFNLQPYSIYYNFEAPENSIFSEYKNLKLSKNYTDYMLVFPLSLQKIITSKNGHLFSLEAGIKFNKVLNSPHLGKICDIYENKTLFDITYYETKKNLYSIFIKAGMIKLIKNNNTLHLNIILNYSPQKIESCDYEFYNLPYESCGVIENRVNYIGIEFAYGLNLF